MKSKTSRHGLKRMTALLLAVVLCIGMIPSAFAAQQDSYHDPAEHWQEANNRTNELDANAVVTIETFTCGECGKATSFEVFRTPEYTRDGQTAMSRNVKYSDGTMVDGEGKGTILDGVPGQDAYYTAYHWTKAVCQTCGGINTNMGASPSDDYGYLRNVYWLYDCANNFFEELPATETIEQVDSEYHRIITTSGEYCGFCYGTFKEENSTLERHAMESSIRPELAHDRFVEMNTCADCGYAETAYSQVFQTLYYCADQIHHGPLPRHVHFILDEAPSVNLPGLPRELATMRSRNISCSTIIQNMAQIKEQFKDSWETIPGNSDTLLYLGGNESSTHKYISEALGKSTIDTKTHGETKGKSGSWSTNMQISGRELLTPDEVRRLDNRYAILLIRGAGPVMDLKYDLMKHPAVRQTSLAGGPPYIHHRQNQAPVISGHEFFAAFSTDDTNENKENAA